MLLNFEWSGADTTGSGYTFKLQDPLNFSKLILKSVAVYSSESSLDGSTPLYLNMNFLGQNNALFSPATYGDSSGRVNDVSNTRIPVCTINELGIPQALNVVLLDGETHFEHEKELTFSLDTRTIGADPFSYGSIAAMSGSDFTDDMRVVVTMETVGGSQAPQSAA
eukprot:COSAG01_NODE_3999_length_5446_cov_4.154853_3_plen_166_part_00